PLEPRRERVLDPSLHGHRLPEVRDQPLERELERVEAELERALLAELLLPADPEACSLGLLVGAPSVAVGVLELVEVEPLAVVEDSLVVEADRVVDASAEEHRSGGCRSFAEHVAPSPVLGAKRETVVARVRQVLKRLSV